MCIDSLDVDQRHSFEQIVEFCRHTLAAPDKHHGVCVIRGSAGTGKSTLLSALLMRLTASSRLHKSGDVFAGCEVRIMVNHAEMWRRYRNLAGECEQLRKGQVVRPTTYINSADKRGHGADIALVDEAHLLLTQPNPYMHFRAENQLREIIRLSQVTILTFDEAQVLHLRSHWDDSLLKQVLSEVSVAEFSLHAQHRMGASHKLRDWVDSFAFGRGQVVAPPKGDQHFEMKVFSDAKEMRDAIRQRAERGRARLLSTYDYPYRLDGNDYYIDEPGLHIRWDRYAPSSLLPWPQRPETLDEVGSVYTIQGLDLDWAGIILGPSNKLGLDGRLQVIPDKYEDQAAFNGIAKLRADGLQSSAIEHAKELLLRDALITLLTRPRKGLFLYAHDEALGKALLSARL